MNGTIATFASTIAPRGANGLRQHRFMQRGRPATA
jgi:hypothetical protein